MIRSRYATLFVLMGTTALLAKPAPPKPVAPAPPAAALLSYNFEIKPILANHCFRCHGPDEKARKAKLRLDVSEEALAKGAWKPGQPDESEAIKRLFSTDPEETMPPPDSHLELAPEQREKLKLWVAQGARYEKHWAFTPPVLPPVPVFPEAKPARNKTVVQTKSAAAPTHFPLRHPADAFILQRLNAEGLEPAPEAEPEVWLRRVTLDLTGLPPTLSELDAFLSDHAPSRHETVVDRLLASPAFGERLANDWLDAARYADSYGRHEDADSPVWPYRDWVARAFNQNLPYDQFLLWQTAGDLLPNATQEQRLATAFNRLANQSNEAGSNEEEFRQDIIADRVKANATAILGLTMECARCHDHKYDPISTREYYSFAAYLNNINELGLYSLSTAGIPAPTIYLFDDQDARHHAELTTAIQQAEAQLKQVAETAQPRWEAWQAAHGQPPSVAPTDYFTFELTHRKGEKSTKRIVENALRPQDEPNLLKAVPDRVPGIKGEAVVLDGSNAVQFTGRGQFRRGDSFSLAIWIKPAVDQERAVILHRSVAGLEAASRGYEIILNHMRPEFSLSHVAPGNSIRIRAAVPLPLNQWTHLTATYDGSSRGEGLHLYLNGKPASAEIISNHLYKDITYRKEWGDFDPSKVQNNVRPTVEMTLGNRYNDMGAKDLAVDEMKVFTQELTPAEVMELHGGTLPKDDASAYQRYLRDLDPEYQAAATALHATRQAEDDFVSDAQEMMVMEERESPRETFVLARGQFDQPTEKVTASAPTALWPVPADFPQNRLGLARWYVDARNPLTARVAVNRLWQMFFGRGLVSTPEDFGIQGSLPSHPELLDWLACDFRDHGWDVKRFCKAIALSSTYRQSSSARQKASLEKDPENLWMARGPKHRLSAEILRDLALQAAAMLNREPGGPPVHTYLPENLYPDSGIQEMYTQDHGDKLWKRSLYLYRKRTLPLPFLTTFDAPTREFCRVRRESTATPLQALALLNAPDFLEPCRVLAEKSLAAAPFHLSDALTQAYRAFTGRSPSAKALEILQTLHHEQLTFYQEHPEMAEELLKHTGESPAQPGLKAADVAALTMAHRAILSDLDTVMKE